MPYYSILDFTAETEYYREFTLTKNGMITIKKYL
jgi:hypothetical protein